MELRVLKYFLMVAREENITKAANLLHISQPTLSRQIIQLEEELGVKLFNRSKHNIVLTNEGILLKRRAQELVLLAEKTIQDLSQKDELISGEISIGCAESLSMNIFSKILFKFREMYPLVRYDIYSANADNIKERIEKGILDLGLLMNPVDIGRYGFIHIPQMEQWGALVRENSEFSDKEFITSEDLKDVPIIMIKRSLTQNMISNWFGEYYDKLEIVGTYNLMYNASIMVKNGLGIAIGIKLDNKYDGIKFIPFFPKIETGSVLVWKKNQALSPVISAFVKFADSFLK